ncbi:hypothetical protein K3162_07010 [Qipengyuania xiapuensis]|uniref:Uncharacterized protein n=1 Tax=Qipengyuania xiapuensis TaxID=2867236 RepID=A0ABX8ZQP2_9SPHN|nr:hypothetical protein [Qipengyuania xiapuensis]QZD91331.1 hypothetical protein K3162_07010 [Qipengyuania xiapuensis]
MSDKDDAWFAAKKVGYGSGLPIAWQGWAVMLLYIAAAAVAGLLWETGDEVYVPTGIVLFLASTAAFLLIAKAKTRGGWKWRPRKPD